VHAGEFEPLAEHGFAACLDGAGADKHAQVAEEGVAQAVGADLEVGELPVAVAGQ
jgi:hypothetical protein